MTQLTQDQVRHVAKLARLKLSEAEVEKFSKQLSAVFSYMEELNEVNTDNVLPTSQVTGLENITREDKVQRWSGNTSDLLGCSSFPIQADQIRVKPIL